MTAPAPQAASSHSPALTLISHYLCPYVQRAAIALAEKDVPFERVYIDLGNKPDWFPGVSPLGKVPVLQVGERDDGNTIFESAVILEYLEDTLPNPLHPTDPLTRARHRAWIEFGSAILNDIAGFYGAKDAAAFSAKTAALRGKFARLEEILGNGPYFAGERFSLVDAVFGPIFRYFDVFDEIAEFDVFDGLPKVQAWRAALAARPSVQRTVTGDYGKRLTAFLKARRSHLSSLMD